MCITCRNIQEPASPKPASSPSECPFCSYMENQPLTSFKANYQFEFGLYLIDCQNNNVNPTYEDAIKYLKRKNSDKAAIPSFDAVFDVYERRGLSVILTRNGQRRLLVKEILDISRFEKILRKSNY